MKRRVGEKDARPEDPLEEFPEPEPPLVDDPLVKVGHVEEMLGRQWRDLLVRVVVCELLSKPAKFGVASPHFREGKRESVVVGLQVEYEF